ncbi:hypothetical protein M422DRAFT_268937 [Sphaerobolus stellatus SS14]|uniref:DUF4219 domain-containing protein n=1 Tax=Sphaerobolus stellatus (strain SS14) TaxID=990650 RepID=A0A0C9TJ10_SPHS4|nr:hypothetical protein M422DRAFT_268937 [Sphaerobolus stellatus SS14]
MSESDSIRFPRLNDTNYAEWSVRMEAGKEEEVIEKELKIKMSKRSASKMAEAHRAAGFATSLAYLY